MKINVFRTQCREGSRVCHATSGEEGVVKKVSMPDGKALVQFRGGDKSWEEHYRLELISQGRGAL